MLNKAWNGVKPPENLDSYIELPSPSVPDLYSFFLLLMDF